MVPNRPRCSSIAIGASAAQCSLTLHEARKSPLLRSGCPHYSTAHDECQHFCSKLSFRKRHFVSCIGEEPFPLFLGGQHILGFLHESSFLSAYKQLNIFHLTNFSFDKTANKPTADHSMAIHRRLDSFSLFFYLLLILWVKTELHQSLPLITSGFQLLRSLSANKYFC